MSNVFLFQKRMGYEPLVNLKHLNSFIPYYLYDKIDKDAYFGVSLHRDARKNIRFHWKGNLYEFLCLCFGLELGYWIFTYSSVKANQYKDVLFMSQKFPELTLARETLIFLLQNLGFVTSLKKS